MTGRTVKAWLRGVSAVAAVAWAAAPTAADDAPRPDRPLPVRGDPPADPTFTPPDRVKPVGPPHSTLQVPARPPVPPPPRVPPAPALPGEDDLFLPGGTRVTIPGSARQQIDIGPRYGKLGDYVFEPIDSETRRLVAVGGVKINVTFLRNGPAGPAPEQIEFAADNVVMWVKGANGANILGGITTGPQPADGKNIQAEIFLSGDVVINTRGEAVGVNGRSIVNRTLRADQIYYDVENSRAVATNADLELAFDTLGDSVHLQGEEIWQLGPKEFRGLRGRAFSSKLPSDPGLTFRSGDVTYVERQVRRRNIFGIPYRYLGTGDPDIGSERILTGRNVRVEVLDVPVFYLPFLRTDVEDPLGPLQGLGFGNDRIFGTQVFTTWDLYKLLALRGPRGHDWRLNLDFLSDRGPAAGTDYDYRNNTLFGYLGPNVGSVKLYGLSDNGVDVLTGDNVRNPLNNRGPEPVAPTFRGRATWRHDQEILADREPDSGLLTGRFLRFQGQFSYLSDKNFLEQYFKQEFDAGPNQETFGYLHGSRGALGGSLLVQGKVNREWETETQWLPRADGHLVGQSLFDLFTYNASVNAGYARFRPSTVPPLPVLATERRIDTGRIDLAQELALPFQLGPVKLAPYGVLDLTGYSEDLTGEQRGRVLGGGGVRGSLPFARLYRDAESELFNVHGLFHKVNLQANYFVAGSDTPYTRLPLLDRLNDDAIDRAYRNIKPAQPFIRNGFGSPPTPEGLALATDPIFDPQRYAIRRLVDNRVDTRDAIHVVQTEVNQRWQTKRGFPGAEHTIDWMVLNTSASFFPEPERDNFGKNWAFLEYQYLWNVGDRTALASTGWFDPFDLGARFWTASAFFQRPDNTLFTVSYRQTDPVGSKAVIGEMQYRLSRKYAVTLSNSYDFGLQNALSNTVSLSRTGTDVTVTLGFTYNALVNNFGVNFMIVPNALADLGLARFGPAPLGARR